MSTFKRFLQYYKPYKGIFFMILFCALIMCIVDLSFPLILSYCTGQFFLNSSNEILKGVLRIRNRFVCDVCNTSIVSLLRELSRPCDGSQYGK